MSHTIHKIKKKIDRIYKEKTIKPSSSTSLQSPNANENTKWIPISNRFYYTHIAEYLPPTNQEKILNETAGWRFWEFALCACVCSNYGRKQSDFDQNSWSQHILKRQSEIENWTEV